MGVTLKEESIGKPFQYMEVNLKAKGEILQAKAPTPLSNGYRQELDLSPELDSQDVSYYHSLTSILRWIAELGRADFNTEVSMMSSHLALPRQGHFQEFLHIFPHLKKYHHAEMVFNPSMSELVADDFPLEDWSYSIYASDKKAPEEELPAEMPEPHGEACTIHVFVDADHAGEHLTRRSRTGFIVFLNNAQIY